MQAKIVKKMDGKLINLGPSKIRVKEEGTLTRNSASVGDLVTIPIGVPHTNRNATDNTSRLLILHTDARMVQFFEGTESLIQSGVAAPQAIATLIHHYNTDIV